MSELEGGPGPEQGTGRQPEVDLQPEAEPEFSDAELEHAAHRDAQIQENIKAGNAVIEPAGYSAETDPAARILLLAASRRKELKKGAEYDAYVAARVAAQFPPDFDRDATLPSRTESTPIHKQIDWKEGYEQYKKEQERTETE